MARQRFVQRPTHVSTGLAFETEEEAWLWATQAVKLSSEGAQTTANKARTPRPCEPRDIVFLAARLRRANKLSGFEMGALCRFGALNRPPDPRDPAEERDHRHWRNGLERLAPELRERGFVCERLHPVHAGTISSGHAKGTNNVQIG